MKKSENWPFFVMILIIGIIGVITFFKGEQVISKTENRKLNTFSSFSINDFLSGDYQDNLEQAISDQFLLSENIRSSYTQVIKHLPTFGIKENICYKHYLELESNTNRRRGTFDCGNYIVYLPEKLSEEKQEIVKENLQKYNEINKKTATYYYFVDDPSAIDFETGDKITDYYDMLLQMEGQKGISRLDYNSYDDYKKFFYKTDHHWDYRGSYQGALDVIKLLGVKDELKPTGIFTNHENFYGSYARATSNYDFSEEFVFYEYDIPKHDVTINGKSDKYNHFEEYKEHNYEYNKTDNYYAYVYGDDYAEIIFDFHQPNKENLLIISNSYSNAINELVAQFFDKTYVIDLRHYKEDFGKDFELSKYLKEKKIDKTLILMSPTFIWAREPNRGLEL